MFYGMFFVFLHFRLTYVCLINAIKRGLSLGELCLIDSWWGSENWCGCEYGWVKMVTWVIAWRSMWDRNFDPVCKKDTPSTTGCDLILHISLIAHTNIACARFASFHSLVCKKKHEEWGLWLLTSCYPFWPQFICLLHSNLADTTNT